MADAFFARTHRACKHFSQTKSMDFGSRCGNDPSPRDRTTFPHRPIVLKDEEIRALVDGFAQNVVDGSIAAAGRPEEDPLLRDVSPIASFARSLVIRSGQMIPDIIAVVLRKAGYEALREHRLPLTKTGDKLVRSNKFVGDIALSSDDGTVDHLDCDLVVIDPITRVATILECTRGTVPLSSARTKGLVRRVRTATLSARSALSEAGIHVGFVTGGIYDRYGRAGYDEDVTLRAEQIDEFFGADIFAPLEYFDWKVRLGIAEAIPAVLGPLLPVSSDRTDPEDGADSKVPAFSTTTDEDCEPNTDASTSLRLTPMPTDVGRLVSPLSQRKLHRDRGRSFSDVSRRAH